MGIELNQYRAAIGAFHGSLIHHKSHCSGEGDISPKLWITVLLVNCLLAICMDVHPHPGPDAPPQGPISLCFLNVRSINAESRLGACINQLADTHDVITLGETWLSDTDEDQVYAINGFTGPYRLDRTVQRGGGGS